MEFRLVSEIRKVERIASGPGVRIRRYLNGKFGRGRWRKMKGEALIEWPDGRVELAEIHWFEAHGIGRKLLKRKRRLGR